MSGTGNPQSLGDFKEYTSGQSDAVTWLPAACAVVNGGAGAGTLHTQVASKVNFTDARFNGTNWLFQAGGPS